MRGSRVAAAIAALGCLCPGAALRATPSLPCAAPGYRIVALPLQPAALNDAAEVAGTTTEHRAAVWSAAAGLRELPLPAGFVHSEAVSINNHGAVAAIAFDAGFNHHRAFVVAGRRVTLLPGEEARPHHISDSGTVSGESQVTGATATQPVLWRGGRMQVLENCCGGSVTGTDALGRAVGDLYDASGRYQAFRWSAAQGMETIGPADRFSAAIAANSHGAVVIQAFPQVQIYRDGRLDSVKLAPRYPSHPRAINDCGVIVGSFGPFSDADRAFRWEESDGFQDLNTLIPAGSGWKLESAVGINRRGEIVGKGDNAGSDDSGFLLVPASDP